MAWILMLSVLFLAYANGANDNFKGVATLLGSDTISYRRALIWATVTTFSGSLAAVFLSGLLVQTFSGKGLVPDAMLTPAFLTASGLGAAATVFLATLTGFPISTTHSLVGALIGTGLVAVWTDVGFASLGRAFFAPLLVSPLLSLVCAAGLYPVLQRLRARMDVEKETCICLDVTNCDMPLRAVGLKASGVFVDVDSSAACRARYGGQILGINAQKLLDGLHFISSGAVSFARGLNDTPKIVALLAGAHLLSVGWGSLGVGLAIAFGGLMGARRVAETMSYRITEMDHGQGFTANLVTSLMVLGASRIGVPVSTTHVSCGALFGMGLATGKTRRQTVWGIALAWMVTLPVAAALAALAFVVLK